MRVLITGAAGMLGADVSNVFAAQGSTVIKCDRTRMEITDFGAVAEIIASETPDYVIHCAAYTDVDACQLDSDAAYAVNTFGTSNIAIACAQIGAVLVYISSCGVFDGQKAAPYNEFDPPRPLTHYHNSKYQAELYVRDLCSKFFIIRPGWLFGGDANHKKNFVAARAREAGSKESIVSANDKFGSPTYTRDLAVALFDLISTNTYGLYHISNSGMASRYEYVSEIIHQLDLPTKVIPVNSDHFSRLAPVPDCEALDNMALRLRGFSLLRPWKEALAEYVRNRFREDEIILRDRGILKGD